MPGLLQRGSTGQGRDGLGTGAGKGREGADGVDVDCALDVGNISTTRLTLVGRVVLIDEDMFTAFS